MCLLRCDRRDMCARGYARLFFPRRRGRQTESNTRVGYRRLWNCTNSSLRSHGGRRVQVLLVTYLFTRLDTIRTARNDGLLEMLERRHIKAAIVNVFALIASGLQFCLLGQSPIKWNYMDVNNSNMDLQLLRESSYA